MGVNKFNTPITFDPEALTFEGKKHTYKILKTLPTCRFKELPLVEYEMSFGVDVGSLTKWAGSAFNSLNSKENWASVSVDLYKLQEALKGIEKREPAIFKFIDLYTVREDEALSSFGGSVLKDKIEDWSDIDIGFFLAIAERLTPAL